MHIQKRKRERKIHKIVIVFHHSHQVSSIITLLIITRLEKALEYGFFAFFPEYKTIESSINKKQDYT